MMGPAGPRVMVSPFRGDEFSYMPPSAAPPLVPAAPPSPRKRGGQQSSHMRHHLRHGVKRVTGFSGRFTLLQHGCHRLTGFQIAPAPLRIQFADVTRVPLPPRRRGQQSSHMRLYMMHGISSPRSGIYTGACSRAFYFPLAMSILCCSGWDSDAAGAAWPAASSAMSGIRVSRAMLMLSASSEERASRHWPFTTFFA